MILGEANLYLNINANRGTQTVGLTLSASVMLTQDPHCFVQRALPRRVAAAARSARESCVCAAKGWDPGPSTAAGWSLSSSNRGQ